MSEPFLGEVKLIGFNFAPRDWAYCDGQLLPINQNQSLFSLLGTMYGGDGRTTFGLPDLRGRVPIHRSDAHRQGSNGGAEQVTITVAEMPTHTHTPLQGTDADGTSAQPAGNLLARTTALNYAAGASATGATIQDTTVSSAGSGQPHGNLMPYITLGFVIALRGLFPSRS